MNYLRIIGGRALQGELEIQGAKNSVLPILAATLLNRGQSVLPSLPAPAGCGRFDPYSAPFGLRVRSGRGTRCAYIRRHGLR